MDYSIESAFNKEQQSWKIKVYGEVDIFNSPEFKTSLIELLNQQPGDLRIDCSDLGYLDSTALGALVGVLKNVKALNREMYLYKLKPNLQKLFKITNLDKVFILEGDYND